MKERAHFLLGVQLVGPEPCPAAGGPSGRTSGSGSPRQSYGPVLSPLQIWCFPCVNPLHRKGIPRAAARCEHRAVSGTAPADRGAGTGGCTLDSLAHPRFPGLRVVCGSHARMEQEASLCAGSETPLGPGSHRGAPGSSQSRQATLGGN